MTAIEGTEGRDVNDRMFGWCWGGPANVDRNCLLIVATLDSNAIADNDRECDTSVPRDDPSFLGGVLIDFGPVTGNPRPCQYWYAIVENTSTGLGISVPIPTDRIGVYHVILGTYAIDPTVDGVLDDTVEGGTRMMIWGTGDAENIGGAWDDRPGTQNVWQWDDDYPINGFHQAPTECYQYFTVCPDPAGAMMATWVAGDLCPCDWDLDADCDTDFADLTALLADYGTSYDFQDIVDPLAEFGCTD